MAAFGFAASATALPFAAPAVAAGPRVSESAGEPAPPGEVDAFMERVFEDRRASWRRLGDFDLRERATWQIGRAGELPAAASRVEYRWSVRGGVALQSPVAAEGVPFGDRRRRAHERRFRRDERRRREGRDSRPRPLGRSEREARVAALLEAEWGITAGAGLRRRLGGDALLLGDDAAAVALHTGDLLEQRGGVRGVGFAAALGRTEALLEMAEQGRLTAAETGRALRGPLAALSAHLEEAGPDEVARFLDLASRASLLDPGGAGPLSGAGAATAVEVRPLGDLPAGGSGSTGAGAATARPAGAASAEEALARVRDRLAAAAETGRTEADFVPGHGVRLDPDRVEPRFLVDHHYYTDWTFEPGRFYLAGREAADGREALRIEYYPLPEEPDESGEPEDFVDRVVGSVHRRTLHTFRVDPATLEIVEHTVENGGLPGFPLRWLLRVDGFRASMEMAPFAETGPLREIRMPKRVEVRGSLATGLGDLEVVVTREFFDYRRVEPASPLRPAPNGAVDDDAAPPGPAAVGAGSRGAGAAAAEVRVFGNAALTDSEVLRLAGLEPGAVPAPGSEDRLAARLRASGRFDRVEARRRFRSLAAGRAPTTVLWVEERRSAARGLDRRDSGPGRGGLGRRGRAPVPAPVVFPILNYADGYGATYGFRLAVPDPLGKGSRLSLPLSWGGERRAGLEFESRPGGGPFSRIRAGASWSERENPSYGVRDRRRTLALGAERRVGERGKITAGAEWSRVRFGDGSERLGAYRLEWEHDTRSDRLFPRRGVFARAGWEVLRPGGGPAVHRPRLDARAFVGLFGRSALAARVRYEGASAPLPAYARPLLGGMESVRGHPLGAEASDRLAAGSVEWRAPLNDPLDPRRWGLRVFYDLGAVAAAGEEFRRARLRRGLGAGVFLRAPFLTLLLDVAGDLEGGGRVHLSTTARF